MSYLTRLPIDFIKIDKSYVDHVDERAQDHAIMEAIILMAHKLGFLTIAEGVETESQLNVLERFGCDLIQGYYYSKPLPPENFYQMVVDWDKSR
jgi:EAL domain-containing protein (putative c-di-GMP-specific phosphodiesterase class I)